MILPGHTDSATGLMIKAQILTKHFQTPYMAAFQSQTQPWKLFNIKAYISLPSFLHHSHITKEDTALNIKMQSRSLWHVDVLNRTRFGRRLYPPKMQFVQPPLPSWGSRTHPGTPTSSCTHSLLTRLSPAGLKWHFFHDY